MRADPIYIEDGTAFLIEPRGENGRQSDRILVRSKRDYFLVIEPVCLNGYDAAVVNVEPVDGSYVLDASEKYGEFSFDRIELDVLRLGGPEMNIPEVNSVRFFKGDEVVATWRVEEKSLDWWEFALDLHP